MRLALICPPFPSHVQVFEVLASALVGRGHEAILILQEGAQAFLSGDASYELIPPPAGSSTEQVIRQAAGASGLLGVLRTVANSAAATDNLCSHLPKVLNRLAVDAIIADQMEPAGGLVARHLGLPYLSLACALPLERDERIPPPYLDWPYADDDAGIKRNRGGEMVSRLLLSAQRRTIKRWAERFGLSNLETLEDCLSPAGTIAQLPKTLDYPRTGWGRPLLHVGPLREQRAREELPIEIDPGRPFVFMSLGTLQGHRYSIFRAVAKACQSLDAQLLVAHCGGLNSTQAASVGATWITDFVPQREALARADICVTHCGQNTVLDALEAGKPLLAIPIAFDQPGMAARIVHHGLGVKLTARSLTSRKAQHALETLLQNPSYTQRAHAVGAQMGSESGVTKAIAHVEGLLQTN
ncbi:glycosyltransferase [Aureimonas fodinaquatilis]|uniref:glycosyltransferase n=1 Tax=Aureimonas fodinaquatilis TaxID=2565783 RepID=UPI00165DD756|nr:glycosyltransferase [Aureimonas fodinaquatilis]